MVADDLNGEVKIRSQILVLRITCGSAAKKVWTTVYSPSQTSVAPRGEASPILGLVAPSNVVLYPHATSAANHRVEWSLGWTHHHWSQKCRDRAGDQGAAEGEETDTFAADTAHPSRVRLVLLFIWSLYRKIICRQSGEKKYTTNMATQNVAVAIVLGYTRPPLM